MFTSVSFSRIMPIRIFDVFFVIESEPDDVVGINLLFIDQVVIENRVQKKRLPTHPETGDDFD